MKKDAGEVADEGVPFWDKVIFSSKRRPTGDLIPQTSWGSSLANLLKASQWQELRLAAIEHAKHHCELCGVDESGGSLEGHEMWSYREPLEPEKGECGIQTLEDVIAICKECHMCFHLGFAQVRGIEDSVLKRLKQLNRWDEKTLKVYEEKVWERWSRFSEHDWLLNLKGRQVGEGFILKKGNTRDEDDTFAIQTKQGNITGILNVTYRLSEETEWSFHLYEQEEKAGSAEKKKAIEM